MLRGHMRVKKRLLAALGTAIAVGHDARAASHHHDVVVYGSTAGGVVAAISCAQQHLSVVLVTPGTHIGGMVSGGLGKTDHGKKEVVGGMSREFFERVGKHYHEPITWYFEPHVAEQTFKDWLAETQGRDLPEPSDRPYPARRRADHPACDVTEERRFLRSRSSSTARTKAI